MSKSILQEVATYNAEKFNSAELKTEISEIQGSFEELDLKVKQDTVQSNNDVSIEINKLLEQSNNINETLNAKMLELEVDNSATTEYIVGELATNYYNHGAMRKEYLRSDIQLGERIDHEILHKISDFMGPMKPIVLNAEGLFDSYGSDIAEASRAWIYIDALDERQIKFGGYNLFKLDPTNNFVTIGDAQINELKLPGELEIEKSTSILNGSLSVHSLLTDPSFTGNNDIISTAGELKVYSGMTTSLGNISTGIGDIFTSNGVMYCTGDISSSAGALDVFNGISTDNGDISTGVGNISLATGNLIISTEGDLQIKKGSIAIDTVGDISTFDGSVSITNEGDITTAKGLISCTSSITTVTGDISITTDGDFITEKGDFHSEEGLLYIGGLNGTSKILHDLEVGGSLTLGDDLEAPSLTLTDNLIVGGTSTLTGNVGITGVTTLASSLSVAGAASVTGTTTLSSTLAVTGQVNTSAAIKAGTDVYANNGSGTLYGNATSANYGDLAEKYGTDADYPAGTVLSIGKKTEVTLYDHNLPLAGVVSDAPAFKMFDKLDNAVYVALKGRVPVKTSHGIVRGMYILPDEKIPGECIGISKLAYKASAYDFTDIIGIALSDSIDGFVEVKI